MSASPGVGFPSCDTALCRIPANRADPHGYYAELGIPPWSCQAEIRAAARRLYRRLHPDTGDRPDADRLQRVKLIAGVLLDPDLKTRYDRTPPGRRLLDAVYRAELTSRGVLAGMSAREVDRALCPESADRPAPGGGYDYLAVDCAPSDAATAQRWYEALVAAAPLVGYRRRIKVLLHDGPAFFHPATAVMAIPRSWTPSTGLAFGLFTSAAGFVPGAPVQTSRHRVE